ncbi:galactose mutarotase-like domain-containing protein [Trichophaea hybrida]|nr:galactose mutarotase-like domain-containing protein [Trichophaea hybrida]
MAVVVSALNVSETLTNIDISNTRLSVSFLKPLGSILNLTLDGQDLLGARDGSIGIGPYLDCYCIPSGFYTIGSSSPVWSVIQGADTTSTPWVGVILSDTYRPTNQTFQQYWFLRGEETGLHTFTRVSYYNDTAPQRGVLQELRTLMRPNHADLGLWTHLSVSEDYYAPLPGVEAVQKQVMVQDTTWDLGQTPEDGYVREFSRYFTKYTFSNDWRNTRAHGLFADGSTSHGTSYGAWLVMNTKDTYFGGPLHSDLTVDGIVYNYIVSNHHGDGTPNITHGFDRTFGPQYYYFNSAPAATLSQLRKDAERIATAPRWNEHFYDSIAPHVVGFIPTSGRGKWRGRIQLPGGAERPVAVLSVDQTSFEDNAADPKAFQYWGEISDDGDVGIDQVVAGTYRLTIYADGIFGDYIQDGIRINADRTTTTKVIWTPETNGKEIWRLGIPDKSSGEFKRGNTRTPTPLAPPERAIYWGAYDFLDDFPTGVNFTIGVSSLHEWNTVHWSVFGKTPKRPIDVTDKIINHWNLNFFLSPEQLRGAETGILTLQLAGVKGASGNTDVKSPTEPWADIPLTLVMNGMENGTETVVVPWWKSSSCIVRSSVSCYQVREKVLFERSVLREGWNTMELRLPDNATDTETAVLPNAIYVQYDALRFELAYGGHS